jgi:hypothetical protein
MQYPLIFPMRKLVEIDSGIMQSEGATCHQNVLHLIQEGKIATAKPS